MARRRRRERTQPSRKEQAMSRREREQARRITIAVGAALGLALLLLLGGVLMQYVITPVSAVAVVNGEKIVTRDFWNRSKFQQWQLTNQLQQFINFQRQLDPTGAQGLFAAQIQNLQSTLSDPKGLANQVLEDMIDEAVIKQAAAENGVVASEADIMAQLEEMVARQIGAVTAPQATATSEALAAATATAAVSTPTPTPTPSPTPTMTVTSTVTVPTSEPQPTPTAHVMTQDEFNTSYQELLNNVSTQADLEPAAVGAIYRQLITTDLLRQGLLDAIGDQMPTTGERVHARHILIAVSKDADKATEQAALAKAISITQRLRNGEDFATLAEQYSDDPGSAAQGGDLGFFGRGQMVPEFEQAAFSLKVGEISDPVRTSFGYHIIKVEERDKGDPDFNLWLQQRKAEIVIERRLTAARLPKLPPVPQQLLTPLTPPTPALPPPVVTPAATPAESTPAVPTPAAPVTSTEGGGS